MRQVQMPADSGCKLLESHEGVTISGEMFQNGEVPYGIESALPLICPVLAFWEDVMYI